MLKLNKSLCATKATLYTLIELNKKKKNLGLLLNEIEKKKMKIANRKQ